MKKRLILSLLLAFFSLANAQTYTIKYNWKKGDKFHFESNTSQDIKMEQAGNTTQTIGVGYTITVDDILPTGNYKCSAVYDKMQLYSSAYADLGIQDVLNTSLDKMLGLGFKIEVTPTGKCANVSGVKDFIRDYSLLMAPGNSPEEKFKRDEFVDKMNSQFTDSTLKAEFENLSGLNFPEGGIKIKESWRRIVSQKLLIDKKSVYNYTLDGIDGDIAKISYTVKAVTDGELKIGINTDADFKITGDGTFKINMQTGLATEGYGYIEAKGYIDVGGKNDKTAIVSETLFKQQEIKN